MDTQSKKRFKRIIILICVAIPLAVAGLYVLPDSLKEGYDTSFLPSLNAMVNLTTSFVLIAALIAVKCKKYELHKKLMFTALILGAIFLISYVIYHATTSSVKYGDVNHDDIRSVEETLAVGSSLWVYFGLLGSHVLLSIIVLPFVLFAAYFALVEENENHKKIVKFAYPIWLYVSISGVFVYLMISPYYV